MFAITGMTGQVGGALGHALLAAGQQVRAIVRDPAKGADWSKHGAQWMQAGMDDVSALGKAFAGAEGVFVMLPPNFDPSPGFPESRAIIDTLRQALVHAMPKKVVALSTIGAHTPTENLLSQLSLMEQAFSDLPMPVTFLRPAWFMENALWDIAPAKESGVIPSFLQPLERKIPMVATADVGQTAARLLQETWSGRRIVELEGPERIAPLDIARCLARLLGRDVRADAVPRATWEALFRREGFQNPLPRMQMLDGFNRGDLIFEGQPVTGNVTLDTVLRTLLARAG
jgi:uncharacterized protein YbjT (DUF2867 family)